MNKAKISILFFSLGGVFALSVSSILSAHSVIDKANEQGMLIMVGQKHAQKGYYLVINDGTGIYMGAGVTTYNKNEYKVKTAFSNGAQSIRIENEYGTILSSTDFSLLFPGEYTVCYSSDGAYENGPSDSTYLYYDLFFRNTKSWSNVYGYSWKRGNGSDESYNAWPGVALSEGEDSLYVFPVNAFATHIIFNDGGYRKTSDIELDGVNAGASCYKIKDKDYRTITLNFGDIAWGEANAKIGLWAFNAKDKSDTFYTLSSFGDGSYSAKIDPSFPNLLFTRLDPNSSATDGQTSFPDSVWNKTSDLSLNDSDDLDYIWTLSDWNAVSSTSGTPTSTIFDAEQE